MRRSSVENAPAQRVVQAKGRGAHGTLTVTKDITTYTRAKVFSQAVRKTDLIARFSTVAGELGAADTEREGRAVLGEVPL